MNNRERGGRWEGVTGCLESYLKTVIREERTREYVTGEAKRHFETGEGCRSWRFPGEPGKAREEKGSWTKAEKEEPREKET